MVPGLPRLLFIEDDPLVAGAFRDFLEDDFQVSVVGDGMRGWEALQEAAPPFELVLMDRNLPGLDGIAIMERVRQEPRLRLTPVVMLTGMDAPEHIAEGLRVGVFYYLTKPCEPRVLEVILEAALKEGRDRHELMERLVSVESAARMMDAGDYRFRTLDEVRVLAPALAAAYPDPGRVLTGISELLINAVEHGNLGIAFAEKSRRIREGTLAAELERRQAQDPYAARRVRARLRREPERIVLTVQDEGAGFDWLPFLELSPERALEPNGRGIAMARRLNFDGLEFLGTGSEVRATVNT